MTWLLAQACAVNVPDAQISDVFACVFDDDCTQDFQCLNQRCVRFQDVGQGFCGDGICGQNEGCQGDGCQPSCLADCSGGGGGGVASDSAEFCGNGNCGSGEDCGSCPGDCGGPCTDCTTAVDCVSEGWACGFLPNGCGGTLFCGGCPTDQTCHAESFGACGFGDVLGSELNPAVSCLELLKTAAGGMRDGVYWIAVDGDRLGAAVVPLYCDMTTDGGGWTLVGQIDGRHNMVDRWLRQSVSVDNLSDMSIATNSFACVNAVRMAVESATEVRLSSEFGDQWVKWSMHPLRDAASWWDHALGQTAIASERVDAVLVTDQSGARLSCFQSRVGVMPFFEHGGSYPYASRNVEGNTSDSDQCMAVGVMLKGSSTHGFTQNGNGFDAPTIDGMWPGTGLDVAPHLNVWLR